MSIWPKLLSLMLKHGLGMLTSVHLGRFNSVIQLFCLNFINVLIGVASSRSSQCPKLHPTIPLSHLETRKPYSKLENLTRNSKNVTRKSKNVT